MFQFGSQTEHMTDVTNFRDSFCKMWNFRKKNISYSRIMENYNIPKKKIYSYSIIHQLLIYLYGTLKHEHSFLKNNLYNRGTHQRYLDENLTFF